jgi:hemoglobin
MSDLQPRTPGSAPKSLYERLGGIAVLAYVVELFYQRVLADAQLAPYFTGVDMDRLRRHQEALLGTVLGGPVTYTGRDLGQIHGPLRINGDDFRRVAGHLTGVLRELAVEPDAVDEVVRALVAVRPSIVTAADAPATPGRRGSSPPWAGPTPPTGIRPM